MSFTRTLRSVWYVFPLVSLGISFTVILGWLTQNTKIIQVYPDMPPMVFNTALCFFILSTGMLFIELQPAWIRKTCGAFVFLVSGLTLFSYLTGFATGIDVFFHQPFYDLGTVAPGRMAMSTSCCFVFLSFSLIFIKKRFWPQLLSTALGALVFGFSFVALTGFVLQVNSEHGWGSYSRMAVHTSICFLLLSAALVFIVRRGVREDLKHPRVYLPFYVLVSGSLLTILMWELLVIQDINRSRGVNEIRVEGVKTYLDNSFYPLEKALMHMGKRFATGHYPTQESWQVDAESYFQDFGGMKRLMWAEADHIFRWVYPNTVDAQKQVGLSMIMNSTLKEALARVERDKKPRMTKSFEVSPGQRAFIVVIPILKGIQLKGTLSALMATSPFLGSVPDLEDYDFSLFEEGVQVFGVGKTDSVFARDWMVRSQYRWFSTNWEIQLTPSLSQVRRNTSILPTVVLVFGISISLLLGLALRFYGRARSSELEVQQALDWQKACMDAIPLLFISISSDGRIREMNVEAKRLLAFELGDQNMENQSVDIFFDPRELLDKSLQLCVKLARDVPPTYECLMALLEADEASATEWTLISFQGKCIPTVLSISPIQAPYGASSGYLLVFEDITLKKERELKIYEQEAKILASSRMASLGEMAAGIAHEINNPLAIINGHAGMIRKIVDQGHGPHDDELKKKVTSIENTVQRIAKIIRGMRSYARDSHAGDFEEFTVDSLIDDTMTFCQEKFALQGISLTTKIDKNLVVSGNATQLSQVLLNLLNNAFDAVADSSHKEVLIESRKNESSIEISVTDSGSGVPVQLRNKVMEPFFTTKEVGQGIGLGLSISAGILQSHGGRLYLDERSLKTRFVISLPG